MAGGQVLLPAGPVLWVLGTGRVEDTLGPVTLVVSSVLPATEREVRGDLWVGGSVVTQEGLGEVQAGHRE